jgi:hypothetical protein
VSEEDVAPHQDDQQESNNTSNRLQRLTLLFTQCRSLAPLLIGVNFAKKKKGKRKVGKISKSET